MNQLNEENDDQVKLILATDAIYSSEEIFKKQIFILQVHCDKIG